MNEAAEAINEKTLFGKFFLTMTGPRKPTFSTLLDGVEQLAKRAAEAESLALRVQKELPEAVRPHVVGAARRGDDLVVIVDSAAWSARVRYAGPRLVERLRELGETVTGKVRVRVRGAVKKAVSD